MKKFRAMGKKKRKIKKVIVYIFVLIFLVFLFMFLKEKVTSDSFKNIMKTTIGLEFKKENILPTFENTKETSSAPIVYIYNTHQTEKYKYTKLQSYNLDYTVMFASYLLSYYLDELGIKSIVEDNSISKTLKDNNLVYQQSYMASRILMENAYAKNPSLKYFIDIHRDSSIYDKTTTIIDNEKYVKFLFVVGLEHESFEKNLKLAENLNNRIKNINPNLSRGIYKKSGPGVDGKYNQDFNENTTLIEVGGQYNEISEVNNSLKVLAKVLYEYIMEDT